MSAVSTRLRASSDALFRAGQGNASIMAREMAAQCDRMGDLGDALYIGWAKQLEARAQLTTAPSGVESRSETVCNERGAT